MLDGDQQADRGPEGDSRPGGPGPDRHRVARAIGAVGRLMMTTGVVILLLVAYQLWGTNLHTDRAQRQLQGEFADLLDRAPPPTTAPATTDAGPPETTPPQVAPTIAPPAHGEVVGTLSIPKIGVHDFYVVEGIGPSQLKRGAGHYPWTPLPGQAGNAAVAGHRTTYGAPLHNVEKLDPGDEILFRTVQGEFRFQVIETVIVADTEVSVLEDKGDNRLTLTACEPKWSAEKRIVVFAELVGNPVPKIEGQDEAAARTVAEMDEVDEQAIDGFVTEPALRFPGAWWGLLVVALWAATRLAAWYGHRSRRYPRWIPYLVGTPVCLFVLFLFFGNFSFEGFARSVGFSL